MTLPWYLEANEFGYWIKDARGVLVAEAWSREDGELIIKACNSQRDMMHALEMIRDADDDCHRDGWPAMPGPARITIDRAIAKGETP